MGEDLVTFGFSDLSHGCVEIVCSQKQNRFGLTSTNRFGGVIDIPVRQNVAGDCL